MLREGGMDRNDRGEENVCTPTQVPEDIERRKGKRGLRREGEAGRR